MRGAAVVFPDPGKGGVVMKRKARVSVRATGTRRLVTATTIVALVQMAAPQGWAGDDKSRSSDDSGETQETPFDEAQLFFELNHTDGDLGIHGLIDGDAWKRLEIEDPAERKMLNIWVSGRLRRQGLTEVFFES